MANEIDALLQENRSFPPSEEFKKQANSNDPAVWAKALQGREAYWASWAQQLDWETKWDTILEWNPPYAKWFVGGKINASYNCLDRHLATRGDKLAVIWEGEPGDVKTFTYRELHAEVSKFANVLKGLGVATGDRVAIYMPLIPEAIVAMLACARISAVHSVIFGGFSSEALRDRIQDAQAKCLITATGGYRRGTLVQLKKLADAAVSDCPSIEHMVVVMRRSATEEADETVVMKPGRDVWYHEAVENASADCPPVFVDSEHMLYTLYTSGTTGKPKGIVHTTGGYLTGVYATTKWVFDLKDDDVYWCTADIGWVTGHSYVVYGPLACGATVFVYEGAPDWPKQDRFWSLIKKHKVSVFYTAPTAIRAFMKWGEQLPKGHDLSSLRLLGSVGEPINPEAWMWYHLNIGGERCPDRRHVVADGDRRDHDHAAPRHRADEAWLGDEGLPRDRSRDPRRERQSRRRRRRLPGDHEPLAVDAARDLRRPRALRAAVLVEVARHLLHRRRREARRRRLFLAPRTCGRRHERRRSPHRNHGGRVRPGRPPLASRKRPWWASTTTSKVRPSRRSSS